jgi:hypothetical protein
MNLLPPISPDLRRLRHVLGVQQRRFQITFCNDKFLFCLFQRHCLHYSILQAKKRWNPPRLPAIERSRVETAQAALNTKQRKAMSYTVSTLLLRNLDDVFGQIDPLRRRAAIDEIFHEDAVFHDPNGGIYQGRDEIDRIAGVIKATHPDFQYQPISPPEEVGDGGRVRWVSGSPGNPPAYAGTDFIIARDGKIAAVYLFFDKLP